MKKLFLHIGTHKTGTSSIQKTLVAEEKKLEQLCFKYLYDSKEKPNFHSFIDSSMFRAGDNKGSKIKSIQYLEEYLIDNTKNEGTYIISSEGFSFFFALENIIELKDLLYKFFDTVKVVTYLRRQDLFAVSFLQEASKTNNAESYMFSGSTLSLPNPVSSSFYNNYFDYFKMMSLWGEAFGNENIIIKIFEKNKLKNGDVVQDFLSVINAKFDFKKIIANESIGFESVKLGLILNQVKLSDGFNQKIRSKLSRKGGKALPSIMDAKEFYNLYKESNKMLNEKFHLPHTENELFNNDFSMYSEKSLDRWDEESASQTIKKILSCCASNFNLDVNALRDAAILLEDKNLELSEKLMRSAHILRPNGPLIKSKLEEYENKIKKLNHGDGT